MTESTVSGSVEEGENKKPEINSLEDLLAGAPDGMMEAIEALNDVTGANYPVPEHPTEEEQPSIVEVLQTESQSPLEGIRSAAETARDKVKEQFDKLKGKKTEEGGEVVESEASDPENTQSGAVTGEMVPDSDVIILEPRKGKKHSMVENAHASLLKTRVAILNLIKSDDESRRLVQAVLQEGLEAQYLRAAEATDMMRARNLKEQVTEVNNALSAVSGQKVSITALYKTASAAHPEQYPPLNTAEGLFALVRYQKELAIKVLAAAEETSEGAEIEAQMALIPLRQELELVKMDKRAAEAAKYIEIAPDLKEAARLAGEVRGQQLSGIIGPILTTFGAAPLYVVRGPAEKFSQWMDDSEDKMEPISAVVGGTVVTAFLVTSGVLAGSILIPLGVGVVGGSVIGIAVWKGTKMGVQAASEKISEWSSRLQKKFQKK